MSYEINPIAVAAIPTVAVLHSAFESILKDKFGEGVFRLILQPLGTFHKKITLSIHKNPAKWLEPLCMH
jgi:hypothetical protein